MKKLFLFLIISIFLISCSEEHKEETKKGYIYNVEIEILLPIGVKDTIYDEFGSTKFKTPNDVYYLLIKKEQPCLRRYYYSYPGLDYDYINIACNIISFKIINFEIRSIK